MIATVAILVILGILLMVMETFLPGMVAGILGAVCVLSGVGMVMFSADFSHWPGWARGLAAVGILLIAGAVQLVWLRWFAVRFWQRTFTLQATVPPPPPPRQPAIGSPGLTVTELRPLGRAEIAGERFEVRSEDGFVPAGTNVIVSGSEPGNLLVRLAAKTSVTQPTSLTSSTLPL